MNTNYNVTIEERPSSGLVSLCVASSFLGITARPHQFAQTIAEQERGQISEILTAAKLLEIKADTGIFSWSDIKRLSFPVIAALRSGEFIAFVRINGDDIIAFDPAKPEKPVTIDKTTFEEICSKQLILLRNKNYRSKQPGKFGFSWFFEAILSYKKTFLEILIASLVIQVFSLSAPLFSQIVIDKVLNHNNTSILYILGVGMVAIAVFECIISILQSYLLSHTASRVDVVLNSKILSHLLRLPLRYFENRTTGNIIAHVREIEVLRKFLTSSTIGIMIDAFFVVLFLGVMLIYSVKLTLVALATLPIFIGTAVVSHYGLRSRLNEKFGRSTEVQSFLVEAVSGIHTIKSLSIEPSVYLKWRNLIAQYVISGNKVEQVNQISAAFNQIIQRFSTIAILWIGAQEVMANQLTIGQLIAFQMIAARVAQPIVRLAKSWHEFQQIGISVERLGDIMNRPAEPIIKPLVQKKREPGVQISLHNLSFKYAENAELVLDDVSLSINAGEVVGIVGRSGSGKSTLVKLLQGLYLPTAGHIQCDGTDTRRGDVSQLRQKIGVVLQESFLFNGTVRENICAQAPNAPHEAMVHAAKLAGAHDFIEKLPNGYETSVGERGEALSGGQRQRVSIARSLLGRPAVLVFDEATSALDYESENILRKNLKGMSDGRTTIIIAHRLSTVKAADKIFVLDNGRLVEQGRHSELIERNGLYRHLYLQQEAA